MIDRYGCSVWAFDPTMAAWPRPAKHGSHAHQFTPVYIGGKNEGNTNTIGGLMRRFEHSYITVLKVDIEGSEWDTLKASFDEEVWSKVNQFSLEVHMWLPCRHSPGGCAAHITDAIAEFARYSSLLDGLYERGFRQFYHHLNPMSTAENLPDRTLCCYEMAMVNTHATL
eukprot:TRINITY_DN370_c0_g1_i4.p1 TRINITY_DN370_c0_g1~~TRINITY_DN370_c0_g1_i4.p1  ORF type:complete len:169 (+),score=28.42 TRINITY_DN370_c0_g1_i4:234-740(+)